MKLQHRLLVLSALAVLLTTDINLPAFAQDDVLEEVVVTATLGSRRGERSIADNPAPIDVLDGE